MLIYYLIMYNVHCTLYIIKQYYYIYIYIHIYNTYIHVYNIYIYAYYINNLNNSRYLNKLIEGKQSNISTRKL